jgi:Flp pilus assembly protein TadG
MELVRVSADVAENETPPTWATPDSTVIHRGQGLVEFALIIPVFLLLVLGIIEFGRLMVTYSSISTASRDAVRYAISVGDSPAGIPHYQDCLGIRAAAENVALFSDPTIVIALDTDGPGGAAPIEYCQVGKVSDPIEVSLGAQISVTVTQIYDPLLPLVELPTIPLVSETARTVLRDVYVK